ncbi:MAG: Ig-like domain-containing protein, partial [Gammaproteobacteria bacterium]|nr:Ig-like domain-containing protein [Gammaproteobacteria bacterium]
ISNGVIEFSSAKSNAITPDSAITDENGQVKVSVGSTAGSDTITASALDGNVVSTYKLNVADDLLTFTSPASGTELAVGAEHTVSVKWYSNGAPVVGQNLVFGVTAGQIVSSATQTTGSDGVASIRIQSVSAGVATVTVEGTGANDPATKLNVEYVAKLPASVEVSAAPRVVNTNSDSVITATVLDANSNPVKGQTVRFETAQAFGGVMSPSAVTDSNGEASVTFTAGSLPTEEDELVIVASVAGSTTVTDSVSLTVNKRELNVTIGTSDNLREQANETQYSQPYVVQVADGSGQPVKNATVRVSYAPLSFMKGHWSLYDTSTPADNKADVWARFTNTDYIECDAEDQNKNGKLDAGEDTNGNNRLDPQNPAVLAADESAPTLQSGSITTDENGFGYFALVYPQSNATWSTVAITASATAQNVEAESTYVSYLPMLAEELNDVGTDLPNTKSPYG